MMEGGSEPQYFQNQVPGFECSDAFLQEPMKRSHNDLHCQTRISERIPSAAGQQTTCSVTSQKQRDADEPKSNSDQEFTKNMDLEGDVKILCYTGRKTYICKQCNKSFSHSSSLKTP